MILMMFLNKVDKRKIALFQLLENAPMLTESKETVMQELELSEFIVNKTVAELNADFIEFGLSEDFQIVSDGIFLTLNESGTETSATLIDCYIKESLRFAMFQDFFFQRFDSVNEFALEHFVSHTLAYKEFKELKKMLENYQITINKEFHLVGNETNLREVTTMVFLQLYQRDFSLYGKKVLEQIRNFELFFSEKVHLNQRAGYAQAKCFHFLAVSLVRTQQQFYVEKKVDSQVLKQLAGDNQQNVFNWLESLQVPEPQRTNEGNYLLLFLIAEEWLQVASAALCQRFAEIQQLNRDLLSYLKIQFQLSEEVLQGFEQKVTIVHFKLFHFPIEANYSYRKMDITYFAETYTEYFSASRQFIQEQKTNPAVWDARQFLFYRYLLLMVDALPLKKVLAPITLCVDFSFGEAYNRMIQKNIEKITEWNIIFKAHVDESVQLILSDIHFVDWPEITQIIWLAPPRPVDWSHFIKTLSALRPHSGEENKVGTAPLSSEK